MPLDWASQCSRVKVATHCCFLPLSFLALQRYYVLTSIITVRTTNLQPKRNKCVLIGVIVTYKLTNHASALKTLAPPMPVTPIPGTETPTTDNIGEIVCGLILANVSHFIEFR